jgi:hypothetical protein
MGISGAAVLFSRTLTKLLPKATEATLVNHVIKWHLLREQGCRLEAQVKPLDVDLAVGAIACNDQKAEPVDMALKISICLLALFRNSFLSADGTRRSKSTICRSPRGLPA